MSDAQIFDPTSYLLDEHQNPGLQPIEPTFEVKETPPPHSHERLLTGASERGRGRGGP